MKKEEGKKKEESYVVDLRSEKNLYLFFIIVIIISIFVGFIVFVRFSDKIIVTVFFLIFILIVCGFEFPQKLEFIKKKDEIIINKTFPFFIKKSYVINRKDNPILLSKKRFRIIGYLSGPEYLVAIYLPKKDEYFYLRIISGGGMRYMSESQGAYSKEETMELSKFFGIKVEYC